MEKLKNKGTFYLLKGIVFCISAAVVLSGCIGGEVSVEVKGDRTIQVKSGQVLKLELESNPTTGYTWEIAGFAGSDTLARMGKYDYQRSSSRIGSGGMQIFKFRAKEKGDAKVIFGYKRLWEKEKEPITRYTVKVTVQ